MSIYDFYWLIKIFILCSEVLFVFYSTAIIWTHPGTDAWVSPLLTYLLYTVICFLPKFGVFSKFRRWTSGLFAELYSPRISVFLAEHQRKVAFLLYNACLSALTHNRFSSSSIRTHNARVTTIRTLPFFVVSLH
jgi:hypothetical protein